MTVLSKKKLTRQERIISEIKFDADYRGSFMAIRDEFVIRDPIILRQAHEIRLRTDSTKGKTLTARA